MEAFVALTLLLLFWLIRSLPDFGVIEWSIFWAVVLFLTSFLSFGAKRQIEEQVHLGNLANSTSHQVKRKIYGWLSNFCATVGLSVVLVLCLVAAVPADTLAELEIVFRAEANAFVALLDIAAPSAVALALAVILLSLFRQSLQMARRIAVFATFLGTLNIFLSIALSFTLIASPLKDSSLAGKQAGLVSRIQDLREELAELELLETRLDYYPLALSISEKQLRGLLSKSENNSDNWSGLEQMASRRYRAYFDQFEDDDWKLFRFGGSSGYDIYGDIGDFLAQRRSVPSLGVLEGPPSTAIPRLREQHNIFKMKVERATSRLNAQENRAYEAIQIRADVAASPIASLVAESTGFRPPDKFISGLLVGLTESITRGLLASGISSTVPVEHASVTSFRERQLRVPWRLSRINLAVIETRTLNRYFERVSARDRWFLMDGHDVLHLSPEERERAYEEINRQRELEREQLRERRRALTRRTIRR